jgi:hypothetical protein
MEGRQNKQNTTKEIESTKEKIAKAKQELKDIGPIRNRLVSTPPKAKIPATKVNEKRKENQISKGKNQSPYEELGELYGHIFKVVEVPLTLEDITVPKSGQKLKLCGLKLSDENHFVRMTVVQNEKEEHGDAKNMLDWIR